MKGIGGSPVRCKTSLRLAWIFARTQVNLYIHVYFIHLKVFKSLLAVLCRSFCASINGCGRNPLIQPVPDCSLVLLHSLFPGTGGMIKSPGHSPTAEVLLLLGTNRTLCSAGISVHGSSIQTALIFHFQCPFLSCKLLS